MILERLAVREGVLYGTFLLQPRQLFSHKRFKCVTVALWYSYGTKSRAEVAKVAKVGSY